LSQRLFEIEPDNFFAEEAFTMQLCLQALGKLLSEAEDTVAKQSAKKIILPHVHGVTLKLENACLWLKNTTVRQDTWPQWLTFEQDVFGALYRVFSAPILLLLACADDLKSQQSGAAIQAAVHKSAQQLNGVPLHPVLRKCFVWLQTTAGLNASTEVFAKLPGLFLLS